MKENKWLISQSNSKEVNVIKGSDLVWEHKKAVDTQGQERR